MEETVHFVRDYHGATTIHPLGLTAVIVLGAMVLVLRRRYAVWPFIAMACFISQAQRIVIMSLDFNLLRIMVLFGFARLLLWGEVHGLQWKLLDTLIVCWTAVQVAAPVINWEGIEPVINSLGHSFDSIGMYFVFRLLVRDWDDLRSAATGFMVISLPVAAVFAYEAMTARNMFAIFGGLPEITVERQGRLRCQGAFAHPILAGCFWAAALPLVGALLIRRGRRLLAAASMVAIVIIVIACASSTPVMGLLFAALGAIMFRFRGGMSWVRWAIVGLLIPMALGKEKPIWHLIARINIVGGSTGWHRYKLIDAAIRHWQEWFLLGSTQGTEHWGRGLFDVTNHYVLQALKGGIAQLLLFVMIIVAGFIAAGRLWRTVESDREQLWMVWAMGIALFIHATNFIAVSYFGQIIIEWYLTLAMIASLAPTAEAWRAFKHTRSTDEPTEPASGPVDSGGVIQHA